MYVASLPAVLGVQAHEATAVLEATVGARKAKRRRAALCAERQRPAGAGTDAVATRCLEVSANPFAALQATVPPQEADAVPTTVVRAAAPVLAGAEEMAVVASPSVPVLRRSARGLALGRTAITAMGAYLPSRADRQRG